MVASDGARRREPGVQRIRTPNAARVPASNTPAPTRPAGVKRVLKSPSPGYATVTAMQKIELIPTRTPDGSIVLRAVGMGRGERLRRFARRLLRRG